LGALFDPACGSDSILCVVAQDLFDRRIVFVSRPEARSPLALNVIRQASGHCRAHAQRLMDSGEVVV
jgi:hypothetical protein